MEREIALEMKNAELKGLNLGDELIFTIKGKVLELYAGAPPEGDAKVQDSKPDQPAGLRLAVTDQKFIRGDNNFEKMSLADEGEG